MHPLISNIRYVMPTFALVLLFSLPGLLSTQNMYINSETTMLLEFFIMVSAVTIMLKKRTPFPQIGLPRIAPIIFLIWYMNVIASFFLSPIPLLDEFMAVQRFQHVLLYPLFFLSFYYMWWVLRPGYTVFYGVVLSFIAILAIFFMELVKIESFTDEITLLWFCEPPKHGHVRHVGYWLAIVLPLLSVELLWSTKLLSLKNLLVSLLFILSMAALFWLGGRGAILAIGSMSLVLLFFAKLLRAQFLKQKILILILLTMGSLLIAENNRVFSWNGIVQSIDRTLVEAPEGKINVQTLTAVSTGRVDFWKAALETTKQSPIIGVGTDSYRLMSNRKFGMQPHSFIFQFILEWGIIGALLAFSMIALGIRKGVQLLFSMQSENEKRMRLVALSVIVALLIHGLTDGTLYHAQPVFFFIASFAILLQPRVSPQDHRSSEAE